MREIKFRAIHNEKLCEVSTVNKPSDNRGSHNFKGSMNNGGYTLRRVSNHPFANKRGYVPEHRLIMEEKLERFLLPDEVVHHINGVRRDNRSENLEVIVSQSKHASIEDRGKRNPNGQFVASDPMFNEIKVRLHNKDRGITKIYSLANLINTTYRRGSFEFRGRSTGLCDKNGTDIYEGDIINGGSLQCNGNFTIANGTQEVVFESGMFKSGGVSLCSFNHIEIIGNKYEKESETK